MGTPALLLRSKVPDRSGMIGKNLRLHPVTAGVGAMPHNVKMWEGAPMTSVSSTASGGHDGSHYGPKVEVASSHTEFIPSIIPWHNAKQYREDVLVVPRGFVLLSLVRDKGSGSVQIDQDGLPLVYYPLS